MCVTPPQPSWAQSHVLVTAPDPSGVNQYRSFTSARFTALWPVLTTWSPIRIWLSVGEVSEVRYWTLRAPVEPPPSVVVAAREAEGGETLPAASLARTV